MRVAVIDTGPLISLAHLELERYLSQYFDVVYVPLAVQREANKKHRFRYRLQKLYATGMFAKCATVDKVNVELLTADEELDEGESEAIIQAQERNYAVFIGDERRARSVAKAKGVKPVGTAAVLARLNLEGLAGDTYALVAKLRKDLGFYVTDSVIRDCIRKAGERI